MGIKGLGRRFFGRARRDERGGILVTAALSMLPITMLCFAAVEFHNFTRHRTALQDALDSASLAVARAPLGSTEAQLRDRYVTVLRSHLDLRPGLVTLVEAAPDAATGSGPQPSLVMANGAITASATLRISPIIANFFLAGDLLISGSSQIQRDVQGLEVALVLDNTGSMATNNRIGIAKTAAANFVTELERVSGGSGLVKIGLVPFAGTVKVGGAYQNASWIDAAGASPISREIFASTTGQMVTTGVNRFTLLSQMGIAWAGCVESRPAPFDVQETAPTAATPASLFVPYFSPDEPDFLPSGAGQGSPSDYSINPTSRWETWHAFQPTRYANSYLWDLKHAVAASLKSGNDQILGGPLWTGYRVDFGDANYIDAFRNHTNSYSGVRGTPLKYTGAAVNAELADRYRPQDGFSRTSTVRGPNRGCDVAPITRLTTNYAGLRTNINAMAAAGSTNIPMGLVWGWHLLSPNAPFSDGAAYSNARGAVTKAVVLMTDGDNAVDGWTYSGIGYASQNRVGTTSTDAATLTARLNARQALLCSNMKARGIVIYTVRVEQTASDPTLMRDCASSPQFFFDVSSAAQLDPTFRQIAASIQSLRIAA